MKNMKNIRSSYFHFCEIINPCQLEISDLKETDESFVKLRCARINISDLRLIFLIKNLTEILSDP